MRLHESEGVPFFSSHSARTAEQQPISEGLHYYLYSATENGPTEQRSILDEYCSVFSNQQYNRGLLHTNVVQCSANGSAAAAYCVAIDFLSKTLQG
jgi:hypothetical protein